MKTKFNWNQAVSILGWVMTSGVVVAYAPERYKPIAAFAATIITGLIKSPSEPDLKALMADMGFGEKLITALEPALPPKMQSAIASAGDVGEKLIASGSVYLGQPAAAPASQQTIADQAAQVVAGAATLVPGTPAPPVVNS